MIVDEYKKIRKEPFIIELIGKFKKNNRKDRVLKTLEDADRLRQWLCKHSRNDDKSKGRSYFIRIDGKRKTRFKLKHEFIEVLERERKHKLNRS